MRIKEALRLVKEAFRQEYGVDPGIDIYINAGKVDRNKDEVEAIIDGVSKELGTAPQHNCYDGDLGWSATHSDLADVTAIYDKEEESNDYHQQVGTTASVRGNGQQRVSV